MNWLCWWHGTIADPKFRLLAHRAKLRVADCIAIWAACLEHASAADQRGTMADIDVELMGLTLDLEPDQVAAFLSNAGDLGLIAEGKIARWDSRQARRVDPTQAERSNRYRRRAQMVARKKARVLQRDANVASRDANVNTTSTVHNSTEQDSTEQDRTEQDRTEQDSTEQKTLGPSAPVEHGSTEFALDLPGDGESGESGKAAHAAVVRVFEHWRQVYRHPKAQLDAKRLKLIQAALRGYSEADLCQAISGYQNSPHHMGENDRATVYDGIELLLRDAAHIDAGLRFHAEPPRTDLSTTTRRNVAAVAGWQPPEVRNAGK
jgi:hypothetical protein